MNKQDARQIKPGDILWTWDTKEDYWMVATKPYFYQFQFARKRYDYIITKTGKEIQRWMVFKTLKEAKMSYYKWVISFAKSHCLQTEKQIINIFYKANQLHKEHKDLQKLIVCLNKKLQKV